MTLLQLFWQILDSYCEFLMLNRPAAKNKDRCKGPYCLVYILWLQLKMLKGNLATYSQNSFSYILPRNVYFGGAICCYIGKVWQFLVKRQNKIFCTSSFFENFFWSIRLATTKVKSQFVPYNFYDLANY